MELRLWLQEQWLRRVVGGRFELAEVEGRRRWYGERSVPLNAKTLGWMHVEDGHCVKGLYALQEATRREEQHVEAPMHRGILRRA